MVRAKLLAIVSVVLWLPALINAQSKSFVPVEGPNLKAKMDKAIATGRTNVPNGRFWVAYEFEARPGVAVDFEIVDGAGGVYISNDDGSIMSDSRHETRELGLFQLFDVQRELFIRAEVYNLRRNHEYSSYPVYWAGKVTNEESLTYLKSIVDSTSSEVNRLAERAVFAIALHDDARVDTLLTEMVKKPLEEPLRSRAIYWLGNTAETTTKNALFSEIARDSKEGSDARRAAMSALSLSRSAETLPLLQNLFENLPPRDLKQRALNGIGRNDNADAAASFLIKVAETDHDVEIRKTAIVSLARVPGKKSLGALVNTIDGDGQVEMQKQAVIAVGRRPKDESVPILIRTARNHPRMDVRKQAIRVLGQTGDERAVAFFGELLSK
jgi:HEAT repeat protein